MPARTASKNGFILNAPALKKQQRTKSSIVKSVCWQHYTLHLRRRKPLCRGSARRLDAIPSSFEALGVEADRRSTSSGAYADIATRRWPWCWHIAGASCRSIGKLPQTVMEQGVRASFSWVSAASAPLGGSQAEDPTRTRYSKNHVSLSAGAGRVIIGTLYTEAYELPSCSIRVASWFRSCRSVPTVPTMFGRTPRISHITLSTT